MANQTKYFKTPFAESGTRAEVPNNSVGGAVGFDTGFGPDYELPQGSAGRKRIERDKYNGLHHSITKNLKQWQEGLYPTWIEDNGSGVAYSYPQGMVVNHAGQDWYSNEAANQEEPGTGSKWTVYATALTNFPKPATRVFNEVISGVSRDTQSRSLDTLNILDFGAIDDDDGSLTSTNSKDAFAAAFAYLNLKGGGRLLLPKTRTGGYFINGDDTTPVTSPVEVVADEGVYLRIIYSGGVTNSPFANNNLKYNRELLKIQQNFGFNAYSNKHAFVRPSDMLPSLTQTLGTYSVPRSLSGLNFVAVDLADPDNIVVPTTQDSSEISFPSAGLEIAAIKAVKRGEETFALLSNPAGGDFFVGVKTLNGYAYYSQNSGTQAITLKESTTGLPPVILGIPYTLMNQQRDLFNFSLLSVRVISARKFSVLCNGLVIGTYSTRSNIIGAMFGSANIVGTTTVKAFSSVKTNSTGGSKPLRIAVIGDSIQDNDVQYSPARIMSSILQSTGLQVAQLNNLSVAGENAAQQYARLITLGSGYDILIDMTGVNDIQGSTSLAAFTATKIDICNYAKVNGMTPIVGLPTQYYSLAEANAHGQTGGQNTANNENGYLYRAAVLRAVGDAGGVVNLQSLKGVGAVSASWLDASITGVQVDSVLTDNIHPTPYTAVNLGKGMAESILGVLHRFDDTSHVPFESVPASWMRNNFGGTARPTMRDFVIAGTVDLVDPNPMPINPEGTPFMRLPKYLNPTEVVMRPCVPVGAGAVPVGSSNIYIGIDGNCYAYNLPVATLSMNISKVDMSDVAFV
jgi:hypothetical protein